MRELLLEVRLTSLWSSTGEGVCVGEGGMPVVTDSSNTGLICTGGGGEGWRPAGGCSVNISLCADSAS